MNNIPKIELIRNKFGLYEHMDYEFLEDGLVNWRKMIPTKFVYPNPDLKRRKKMELKYKKDYKDIKVTDDNVEDEDLAILLKGIQYISKIRGYDKINYTIKQSNDSYAAITCEIQWIPNFETSGRTIIFSENASATLDSTHGFGRKYLVECCSNRAFSRCVGNFLNINLQSFDAGEETGEYTEETQESQSSPQIYELLEKALKSTGKTFDTLKDRLIKEDFPGADKITKLEEIPPEKAFYFLDMLKNLKKS